MGELITFAGDKLEIKSITDTSAIIEGYGIVFYGRDKSRNGDTFLPNTDYNLKNIVGLPVYIEHTLTGINESVGEIINYSIDNIGMKIQARLDTTKSVVRDYLDKIKNNLVGWSSGAVSHLVRRTKNIITKWAIGEFSLTTNPAEPRTISYGLQQIKSNELVSSLERGQETPIETNAKTNNLIVETNLFIKTNIHIGE